LIAFVIYLWFKRTSQAVGDGPHCWSRSAPTSF